MKRFITKAIVSTMLVTGSLGMIAATTIPAGATTTATALKTLRGKVKTADTAKYTFTLTSGAKTYTVHYKAKTKFAKGSAVDLKAGVAVSVTGKLVKTVIEASSISA